MKTKPTTRSEEQKRRKKERVTARKALVDDLLKEHAPLLWSRQANSGITEQTVEKIIEMLSEKFPTRQLAKAIQHLRNRLRFLRRKTGGEVYLPMPAVAITADPSPYRDNAMLSVSRLNQLNKAFISDVSRLPAQTNEASRVNVEDGDLLKVTVGRILYSAVVNGGLLDQSLVWRLPNEIAKRPVGFENLAWISFPLISGAKEADGKSDKTDEAVRRWIVDYVTLGLILRLLDEYQQDDIAAVSGKRALRAYLEFLKRESEASAGLVISGQSGENSFFDAAATRLSFSTPPVTIRFLKSTRRGESMSERSWWRYHFQRAMKCEVENASDPEFDRASPISDDANSRKKIENFQGVHQQRLVGKLRRCFSPLEKDKQLPSVEAWRRVTKVLDASHDQMSPLLFSLYRWFEFILSKNGRSNGPVKASTAATYRQRIVPPLIDTNWEFDIREPNPEVWEEFYADTLLSITAPVQRKHAGTTIRLFHQYMIIAAGAPPVMVEGELEEGVRIRNSILSESDYQAVRDYLHETSGDRYFLLLLEVIVILMFRAGLRPNDIVGLKFRHIAGVSLDEIRSGTSYPVIYPRHVQERSLKTSSAVRQIPLPWLVPPDELDVVLKFFETRLVNCRDNGKRSSNAWVFASIRNSEDRMPGSRYFGYISKLLKQICEDPDVVCYSLRHSFLSIWALKILSGDIDDPDHPMLRPDCLPREIIYTLSELGAHDAPDISLSTYIKTMDLAAFHCVQANNLDLTDAVRSRLEGTSVIRLKRLRAAARKKCQPLSKSAEMEIGYRNLVSQLATNPPPKLKRFVYEGLPEKLTEPSVTDLELRELFRLCRYLGEHGAAGVPPAQRIFSLQESEIVAVREHGLKLGALGTNPRSGGSRSRMLRQHAETSQSAGETIHNTKKKSWAANRRAGDVAPALPISRTELAEAERIYALLTRRARKAEWDPSKVNEVVLTRVMQMLVKSSVTERGLRIRSREEYEDVLQTVQWLKIPKERVKIKVESLPREPAFTFDEWHRRLVSWSPWKRLAIKSGGKGSPRLSRDYPAFGICLIQILESLEPSPDVQITEAEKRFSRPARAAASWRVGCYYAVIAIQARLGSKPDSTEGLAKRLLGVGGS